MTLNDLVARSTVTRFRDKTPTRRPGGMLCLLARCAVFGAMTLVLTVAGGAEAAEMVVADGVVEVAADGQCSLIEAFENANDDAATHEDCAAGDGPDTIVLAASSVYTLIDVHNDVNGGNGLPTVGTEILVEGNGAVIERSADAGVPEFRLLHVDAAGNLSLDMVTLRNGQTADETPREGGAIRNLGTLAVSHSTLTGNSAALDGGGVTNGERGTLVVSHSTFSGNSASSDGGGIENRGTLTIDNSTLSGNEAADTGGGILNSFQGTVTITHSTLSGNEAAEGGGIFVVLTAVAMTLRNTLIGDSTLGGDCVTHGPAITYEDVNLVEDGTCGCTGPSCLTGDPALAELANNGGPTETHALLDGSIAIDAADDTVCAEDADDDQRGAPRPLGSTCDIGAYEAGVTPILTFDRSSLHFGNVESGSPSEPLSATLTNTGSAAAINLVLGTPGGGFTVDDATDCDDLDVGNSCEVGLVFSPAGLGPAEATLEITSGEGATAALGLTGNGVAPSPLTIIGTVVDEDGQPLEGATVTLSGSLQAEATTAADRDLHARQRPLWWRLHGDPEPRGLHVHAALAAVRQSDNQPNRELHWHAA